MEFNERFENPDTGKLAGSADNARREIFEMEKNYNHPPRMDRGPAETILPTISLDLNINVSCDGKTPDGGANNPVDSPAGRGNDSSVDSRGNAPDKPFDPFTPQQFNNDGDLHHSKEVPQGAYKEGDYVPRKEKTVDGSTDQGQPIIIKTPGAPELDQDAARSVNKKII